MWFFRSSDLKQKFDVKRLCKHFGAKEKWGKFQPFLFVLGILVQPFKFHYLFNLESLAQTLNWVGMNWLTTIVCNFRLSLTSVILNSIGVRGFYACSLMTKVLANVSPWLPISDFPSHSNRIIITMTYKNQSWKLWILIGSSRIN